MRQCDVAETVTMYEILEFLEKRNLHVDAVNMSTERKSTPSLVAVFLDSAYETCACCHWSRLTSSHVSK